ncbi:DNA-binding protein [Mycolicibacterium sp. P1-18]|uniref:helix-turn-helix transcriptional regulator n=1 Tax=Mycolicibacterium sp. P1-18 TaxID=2024615 RepID=UPI0011F2145D|nr:helix-turn-helix domain-containing protein [Mycolicibacterium sp. P1-18]KAA0096679.1 DNA-binding protein [Mycolicibacterium sp. P1-18]
MIASSELWLTRKQVSERLQVPTSTLAHWGRHGKGPRFAKFGNRTRYRISDVAAWESAQFADSAAAAS